MFDIRTLYRAVKNGIRKTISPGDSPAEAAAKFTASGAAYNPGNMVTLKFLKKGPPKAVPPPVASETVGTQPKKATGGGYE